jgi:3-oxoacyl-[acyl-carrier-protein] synthase-1
MNRISEPDIFVVADNILSPLGKTSAENFAQLKNNASGVKQHNDETLSPTPFFASLFDKDQIFIDADNNYTKFEQLLIVSITDALKISGINSQSKSTVLIISSTKGNISLLDTETNSADLQKRISLSTSARLIAEHFRFQNQPVVISNACISGVIAIITGMRLLKAGQYENAVICGADTISKFIVSGFQSFQALSDEICKPFDSSRNGLNLGEGAATVILSTDKKFEGNIKVKGQPYLRTIKNRGRTWPRN